MRARLGFRTATDVELGGLQAGAYRAMYVTRSASVDTETSFSVAYTNADDKGLV